MEQIVEFITMRCFGHQKSKRVQETIRNLWKKGLSKTVKCNDARKKSLARPGTDIISGSASVSISV